MSLRIIFCSIVIFALVPARAKNFAQWSSATNDSLLRNNGIYSILLNEGIDSLLNSNHLQRSDVNIVIDDSAIMDRNLKTDLHIIHLDNSKKILFNNKEGESGEYFVTAKGKLINNSAKDFFFQRYRKYYTKFETISSESNSFWDSAAKPILVTLGAVAVIALFFLVRG
jgi:hypothetical protein